MTIFCCLFAYVYFYVPYICVCARVCVCVSACCFVNGIYIFVNSLCLVTYEYIICTREDFVRVEYFGFGVYLYVYKY